MTTAALTALDTFGLSNKEAAVYLALLELGKASASQVAERASINRATTYVALESLIGQGLARIYYLGKKRLFVAENPHQLVALAENNKEEWTSRLHEIETVMPDLDALYQHSPNKPQVRFYEGKNGLKTVFEDTLETDHTTLLIYADIERSIGSLGDYFDRHYIPARIKRQIKAKVIFTNSQAARARLERNRVELRESRFAPADCHISNEIIIYHDKVAILTFDEPEIGIIMQHPAIAATQRAIFHLAWDAAGRSAPPLSAINRVMLPVS